jgi:hypothetical protein
MNHLKATKNAIFHVIHICAVIVSHIPIVAHLHIKAYSFEKPDVVTAYQRVYEGKVFCTGYAMEVDAQGRPIFRRPGGKARRSVASNTRPLW